MDRKGRVDDRHIEQLLRRYAPVAPPPGLRKRVLKPLPMIRVWPWAAAASVLLAGTVALHVVAGRTLARVEIVVELDPARLAVEDLTEKLGGGDAARAFAEAAIARTRSQAERAAEPVSYFYTEAP